MKPTHPVYRLLLGLYPAEFRRRYGDDLVQHFADLLAHRGPRVAWLRTGVDLAVTVPRYRLEGLVNESHTSTTITVIVAVLAAAGLLSVLTGLYAGLVLLAAAGVLAVAQRSALARAIRTPDRDRRRRRLRTAAFFAAVFVASVVSYLWDLSDEAISGTSLVLHNVIGVPSMVGAIVYLVAGLLTPADRESPPTSRVA